MTIPVYDYRTNLTNLVVEPEIRSRFRRVELGPVPEIHSHDLGGETFVVMAGQIEFTVADEHVVCQPGQAIFVPPRTTHAVRAVGAETGRHVPERLATRGADAYVLWGRWRALTAALRRLARRRRRCCVA